MRFHVCKLAVFLSGILVPVVCHAQGQKTIEVTAGWYPEQPADGHSEIQIKLFSPVEPVTGQRVTIKFNEGVLRRRMTVQVTTGGAPGYITDQMTFRAHRYLEPEDLEVFAPIVKIPNANDSTVADRLILKGAGATHELELFAFYLQAKYVTQRRIETVGVSRATKRDVRLAREVLSAATRLGNTQQFALRSDTGLDRIVSWLRQLQADEAGKDVLKQSLGSEWEVKLSRAFLALDEPETKDFKMLWAGVSGLSDPHEKYVQLIAFRNAFVELKTAGTRNVIEQAVISRPDMEMAISACLDQILRNAPEKLSDPIEALDEAITGLNVVRTALATDEVYQLGAFSNGRAEVLKSRVEAHRTALVNDRTALAAKQKLASLSAKQSGCTSN
jgi:hypothetical protein